MEDQRVRSVQQKTSQQVLHINGHMAPKAWLTEIHVQMSGRS